MISRDPNLAHLSDEDLRAMVVAMHRPHVGSFCLRRSCYRRGRRVAHAHADPFISAKRWLTRELWARRK